MPESIGTESCTVAHSSVPNNQTIAATETTKRGNTLFREREYPIGLIVNFSAALLNLKPHFRLTFQQTILNPEHLDPVRKYGAFSTEALTASWKGAYGSFWNSKSIGTQVAFADGASTGCVAKDFPCRDVFGRAPMPPVDSFIHRFLYCSLHRITRHQFKARPVSFQPLEEPTSRR